MLLLPVHPRAPDPLLRPGPVLSRWHPDLPGAARSGSRWGQLPGYTELFLEAVCSIFVPQNLKGDSLIAWQDSGAGSRLCLGPPNRVIRGHCRSPGAQQQFQPPGLLRAPGEQGLPGAAAPLGHRMGPQSPAGMCVGQVAQRTGRGRARKAARPETGKKGFGEGRCFILRT